MPSVTIPSSVLTIGSSAFSNCTNLATVTIQDGTDILDFGNTYSQPFYRSGIQTLHLGRNISYNSAGGAVFEDITTLSNVTIGEYVTSIGTSLFKGCSGLQTLTINGNTLVSIGYQTFSGCSSLRTPLVIPNQVTTIGSAAFSGCSSLPSVVIPPSVVIIESSAFSNCTNLATVTIQDGTDILDFGNTYSQPFYRSGIQTLHLGRNISYNSAGGAIFEDITTLSNVTIGEYVTSIGTSLFKGCSGLQTLTINGNALASIGYQAFSGCSSLRTPLVITNQVTTIGSAAFSGCSSLPSVVIPPSVVTIESSAFSNCTNLANVTIQNGNAVLDFTNTYSQPFYGCGIQTLHLGRNLSYNSAGGAVFEDITTLSTITIGNYVTSIGTSAFRGCTGLTQIISKAIAPPTLSSNAFYNVPTNIPVYVPCGSYINYQNAWTSFTNFVDYCTEVIPAENSAVISWTEIENAVYYEVIVYADEAHTQIIGHYTVDFAGNVTRIRSASEQNELSLTVYGLSANTPYYYTITSYNAEDTEIVTFTGDFTTTSSNNSIENVIANQMSMYPNPAKDEIFIKSELQIKKVEIYSLTGSLMISESNFNGKISVSVLPQGIYLIKVYSDKGVAISKIVKE